MKGLKAKGRGQFPPQKSNRVDFFLHFDYTSPTVEIGFKKVKEEWRQGKVGYYRLPELSQQLLKWKPNVEFSEVVVVGIGGSSLGAKGVYHLNRHFYSVKPLIFLENPDPIDILEKVEGITSPLFFIISKSGRTIETISIFKYLIYRFGLKPGDCRVKIVTDRGSPLDRLGEEWKLERFFIPSGVGGRFSVMGSVGVLPLLAVGFPVEEMLEGGATFRDSFFKGNEFHLAIKGAFYGERWADYPINVLFAYSTTLNYFKEWYVQLLGESLGKREREIMPVGHIGSIDQHSFLQLLMEGIPNKTLTFLKIANFKRQVVIPSISLPNLATTDFINGYPFEELINFEERATLEVVKKRAIVDEITLPEVNLHTTGQLLFYYKLLTSFIGQVMGIDTYNQNGVEAGKQLLPKLFQKGKSKGKN